MTRARALFALAMVCPALGALGASWTVPGLSNAPGRNNTFFASELKLRNPGTAAAQVTFELLPIVGGAVPAVTRTIAAGETLVLANALQELWGSGDRAGAARLSSAQALYISARTYNTADPAGTFGLGVEAVPEDLLFSAGQTGHIGWLSESADGSAGFRTNVGIVLPSAGASVDAVVIGANGTELGRRTFSGGPLATQVGVRDIAGGDLSVARLELRVTSGKATGYSAVVDNVTGDGFTVQPQLVTPGTWADLFLNGASRGPGRFDTFFRTDVRLVNPSSATRTVTVTGVSLLAGGKPFPATATIDVEARAVREVNDVLSVLLHAPEGTSGSLRFETDGPLLVLGRTSNIRRDGSTFGAVQRTLTPSRFLTIGVTGTLIGLAQSSSAPGYRTNVGFLAGPAGATLDLTLRDRTGAVLATRPGAVALGSHAFYQPPLSDLFPGISIPEHVTVEVTPTDGNADVYASFIDNGTGDPVIYAATPPALTLPPTFDQTSPCAPQVGVGGGAPEGTSYSRVDIDPARHPSAVCNDGSPGVFYVRRGSGTGLNRWILYLEGGGGCASGNGCAQRWCSIDTPFGANLMASRYAPARGTERAGILGTREGSAFNNLTKVWFYYCSSDAWSGRSGARVLSDDTGRIYTIHFEGSRILEAALTELRAGVTYRDAATGETTSLPSLDDAEVVFLAGESAGSLGVQRNVDRVGEYLRRTNRNPERLVYRAFLDAANEPSNESFSLYESQKRNALRAVSAIYAGRLDESCLAWHPGDAWRCADTAHVRSNHLTTPFFARQDLVDPMSVDDTFGTPEWPFGTQKYEFAQFTWDHLDSLSRIRSTAEEKTAITVDPGLYGPHCDQHTALRKNELFFLDKVALGSSLFTYHDTLLAWLLGSTPSVVLEKRPTSEPAPKSAVCTPD